MIPTTVPSTISKHKLVLRDVAYRYYVLASGDVRINNIIVSRDEARDHYRLMLSVGYKKA